MVPLTPPTHDLWSVDEASLAALTRALSTQPSDKAWFELRRDAEHLALTPGFDRLITLDANTIKELPHQIDVPDAPRERRRSARAAAAASPASLGAA